MFPLRVEPENAFSPITLTEEGIYTTLFCGVSPALGFNSTPLNASLAIVVISLLLYLVLTICLPIPDLIKVNALSLDGVVLSKHEFSTFSADSLKIPLPTLLPPTKVSSVQPSKTSEPNVCGCRYKTCLIPLLANALLPILVT